VAIHFNTREPSGDTLSIVLRYNTHSEIIPRCYRTSRSWWDWLSYSTVRSKLTTTSPVALLQNTSWPRYYPAQTTHCCGFCDSSPKLELASCSLSSCRDVVDARYVPQPSTSVSSPIAEERGLGLVQFIADLRNARARELEEKRINKELANIRLVSWQPPDFPCQLELIIFKAKVQRQATGSIGEGT
jgi:hypothetical protein